MRCRAESSAKHVMDLIVRIMEDEEPLVRLRVIQKVPLVAQEVPTLLTRLSAVLKAHLTDVNWRVRQQVCTLCSVVQCRWCGAVWCSEAGITALHHPSKHCAPRRCTSF